MSIAVTIRNRVHHMPAPSAEQRQYLSFCAAGRHNAKSEMHKPSGNSISDLIFPKPLHSKSLSLLISGLFELHGQARLALVGAAAQALAIYTDFWRFIFARFAHRSLAIHLQTVFGVHLPLIPIRISHRSLLFSASTDISV